MLSFNSLFFAHHCTCTAVCLGSASQWFFYLIWIQSLWGGFFFFSGGGGGGGGRVTGWAPEPRPAAATRSGPSPSSRLLMTPAGRQSVTPKTPNYHQQERLKHRNLNLSPMRVTALSLDMATFLAISLHDILTSEVHAPLRASLRWKIRWVLFGGASVTQSGPWHHMLSLSESQWDLDQTFRLNLTQTIDQIWKKK